MHTETLIETLDTHTAGEPTRIITSGLDRSKLSGDSVAAKCRTFAQNQDWLRELVLCEPRGHDDMFGAVPVEPAANDADLGLFFMDTGGYLEMCGHGTIGAVTALLETNQLEARETITVETPAGLVRTHPTVDETGRVESVAIRNVESFVADALTVSLEGRDETRSVPVDIVFAGNAFALVDAGTLGRAIEPDNVEAFVEDGLEIRRAINDRLTVDHPFTGECHPVSLVEFYEEGANVDRNVVVFGDGQVDRSPCGTGTCAKMTLLHRNGALAVDEPYTYESIIGTRFTGQLLEAERRDGITVTTPEVRGSAHITGQHTFTKDPEDEITGLSLTGAADGIGTETL
ncbi:proline racemase [Halostagnicola larsenii XH-48]|uniref:Proline racemase n=1 Tax=Halostagnicola larsenii XH-48 TaxID=797299 RepID=W0JP60_9EURY|nr:proline racemase family protein [Halostagnicola larsenii]AHG00369.1 proline racemase [Halostagnicola larsenii XH-48]